MNIHTDGWDIDNNGHSVMDGVCCVACHEEVLAHLSPAAPIRMYVVELVCNECFEAFTPPFDQFEEVTR